MLLFRAKYLLVTACMLISLSLMATEKQTISDYIVKDSNQQVTIDQPEGLHERLKPESGSTDNDTKKIVNKNIVGYRIQVFSDNNQRTAKNMAQVKERNILSRFPQLRSYLQYKAPQWRLRVGDFRTRGEARAMLQEIKEAFPSYASEMTVVMDRINPAAL